MDLRQLAYVEAVARNANFTRAADELHVAQPALSVAIRRLETELGVRLFERTSRRVTLTPAGTAFLERAGRVSREVDAIAFEMRAYAGGVRGRLRLSAWFHVEPDLVPFMREFTATNPMVEVSIRELSAVDSIAALRSRDIDLAAVARFPEVDALDNLDGLQSLTLRTEPTVLVLRQGEPLARREALNLADVTDLAFIVTGPGTGLRRLFDHVFVTAGRRPMIGIETNELAAMVAFASAGLGCAVLCPSITGEAGFPVSMVPLADVAPFAVDAVWRTDERDPVVLSAVDLICRHMTGTGVTSPRQAVSGGR
jgi:DNA-binding transcriptional LysR family regulator